MSEKEQLPSAVDDAADVMSQYERPSYDDPAPVKQYEGPELLHMTHPSLKKVPTEVNVEAVSYTHLTLPTTPYV